MPRSPSDNLKKLGFSLVKTPDNKYNAYCSVCEKNLCNTAALRLRAHRYDYYILLIVSKFW